MANERTKRCAASFCSVSKICDDMIQWEERGEKEDQDAFEDLLDPSLRFRRGDDTVVDKKKFIDELPKNAGRGRTLSGEIDVVHYDNMAVAVLVVDVKGGKTRNARVFLRGGKLGWRLVSWCNERVP
jgi:hypothetical protein